MIFYTTYCNKGHRVSNGRPIDHECHILPPAALRAEIDGDYTLAMKLLDEAKPLAICRGGPHRHQVMEEGFYYQKCKCGAMRSTTRYRNKIVKIDEWE